MTFDEMIAAATKEGYDAGKMAGSWVTDGNMGFVAYVQLLDGIEEGDPRVLDTLPSSPLSGEFADGLLPADVLGWYGLDESDDGADDVLSAFEFGYSQGVEDEVVRACKAQVEDEEPETPEIIGRPVPEFRRIPR